MNLQLGLESLDRLSQVTLLLSYASDRVTSRVGGSFPDIKESTGLKVDVVARQGFRFFEQPIDLKLEVRNIFGEATGVPADGREYHLLQQVRHRHDLRAVPGHEVLAPGHRIHIVERQQEVLRIQIEGKDGGRSGGLESVMPGGARWARSFQPVS